MDKKGLNKAMPASEKVARDVERGKAKNMTELRQRLALHGRNGIIVNGTGDDAEKIKKIKSRLEELGYDTAMIMVNTRDEVSASRNVERGQRGGRSVPETIRKQKWQSVQDSRADLAKLFGDKYVEFDNSEDLRSAKPEIVQAKKEEMLNIYKGVQKFIKTPPKAPQAKDWIGQELEKSDRLPVNTKVDSMPHPNSGAADEARKMGLQYYGFGRYGKDGKVTYRSVHDKLQQVKPDEPKATPLQTKPTAKKVNEEFENEFANTLLESALEKFRAAAAEREKKHDEIEAKRKEAAAQGKENMSAAIDRLEKHLNKESINTKDLISKLKKDLPKVNDPKNKDYKHAKPVNWTGPKKDDYGYTGYQGHGMPTDKAERARIRADKKKGVAEDNWDSGEDVTVTQDDQSTTLLVVGMLAFSIIFISLLCVLAVLLLIRCR
jgi:DNA-binding protein H-NS